MNLLESYASEFERYKRVYSLGNGDGENGLEGLKRFLKPPATSSSSSAVVGVSSSRDEVVTNRRDESQDQSWGAFFGLFNGSNNDGDQNLQTHSKSRPGSLGDASERLLEDDAD